MKNNYDREIRLLCPTCGGTQFEHDETNYNENKIIKCVQCNRETTQKALIDENSQNINTHVDEIGEEVFKDFAAEIKKIFK